MISSPISLTTVPPCRLATSERVVQNPADDAMRVGVAQRLVQGRAVADIGEQYGDLCGTGRHRSPRDGDGTWVCSLVVRRRVSAGRIG